MPDIKSELDAQVALVERLMPVAKDETERLKLSLVKYGKIPLSVFKFKRLIKKIIETERIFSAFQVDITLMDWYLGKWLLVTDFEIGGISVMVCLFPEKKKRSRIRVIVS